MKLTTKKNIVNARSHIAILIGLLLSVAIVIILESWNVNPENKIFHLTYHDDIPISHHSCLNETEREWAQIAWNYFENNYQENTGLVNSVDQYPSTTLWDTASYLMALIASYRLEIIPYQIFESRLSQVLITLASLELFEDKLPNKSYNTETLGMSNYDNTPSSEGIGWSAIDLSRLLVPLHIIIWNYPEHTQQVLNILKYWEWSALVSKGQMFGADIRNGEIVYVQEGRIGYEQYAARALKLLGFDMSIAGNYLFYLHIESQFGIDLPVDSRDRKFFDANNYVLSEPYILEGLEFGWGRVSGEFAWRLYRVQEERYKATGILTAVSEDHVDQLPYFVYNTIFVNGNFWKAVTDKGEDMEYLKSLSTKAVFAWHVLYNTDYTTQMMEKINKLYDPDRGWYAGIYEQRGNINYSLTANTNAVVLESLAVKQFGPLLQVYNKK